MSYIYTGPQNVNQGYVRSNNTSIQLSTLLGGTLAKAFDFSCLKIVKAYATLAATSPCQVYENSNSNAAGGINAVIPLTGLNVPVPFRLGFGDVVVGIGMLSESSTLSSTSFNVATAGNVASTGATPTAIPTFTAFSAANTISGCFQLNNVLLTSTFSVPVITDPGQYPGGSPLVAPYVFLTSLGTIAPDAGKVMALTFLIINVGVTSA